MLLLRVEMLSIRQKKLSWNSNKLTVMDISVSFYLYYEIVNINYCKDTEFFRFSLLLACEKDNINITLLKSPRSHYNILYMLLQNGQHFSNFLAKS